MTQIIIEIFDIFDSSADRRENFWRNLWISGCIQDIER